MMNKNLKQILFKTAALSLLVGSVAHAEGPHFGAAFVELDTDSSLDGKSVGTGIYANIPYSINDRYSIVPEIKSTLGYRNEGKNKPSLSHDLLRVLIKDKHLAQVGSWKLGMSYRYSLPTTLGDQAAGNLGSILFRPDISSSWGPVSLMVRYGLSIPLNRNGYQVNPPGNKAAAANTVIGNAIEILPSWDVVPHVNFSAAFIPTFNFKGPLPYGQKAKTRWSNAFEHYYEVGYQGPATKETGVGAYFDEVARFGGDNKFKIFTKSAVAGIFLRRNF